MSRRMALTVLVGFLIGLALGCASKPSETSGGSDTNPTKPGEPPQPPAKGDITDKAKPAEPGKPILAKEPKGKEPEAKGPDKDGVYRSAAALFADMPEKASPKSGGGGGIERANAKEWCDANLKGRVIEWTVATPEDGVDISGNGPFNVRIWVRGMAPPRPEEEASYWTDFGDKISLGGQACYVNLSSSIHIFNSLAYSDCTAAEADVLRKLQGKQATLRARVLKDCMVLSNRPGYLSHTPFVWIYLPVTSPSINGWLPAASKKDEK